MAERLLFDTDVLIDYLRDQADAVAYVESAAGIATMSAITYGELYGGVREGRERHALDVFTEYFEIIPVDRGIALRGGLFRRDYRKSHNVGLADALIAATAEAIGATLVTLNLKHYPMLADVIAPYRKTS